MYRAFFHFLSITCNRQRYWYRCGWSALPLESSALLTEVVLARTERGAVTARILPHLPAALGPATVTEALEKLSQQSMRQHGVRDDGPKRLTKPSSQRSSSP